MMKVKATSHDRLFLLNIVHNSFLYVALGSRCPFHNILNLYNNKRLCQRYVPFSVCDSFLVD